jgi:thiol-disulfide isomerase/thioredoxin
MRSYYLRLVYSLLLVLLSLAAAAQPARIVKLPELARLMNAQSDTTYVFNFFATWCDPCVSEFPNFQKISTDLPNKKLRVIFVSLDFRKVYKRKLLPFLRKHHVTNETVLLDEPDYNSWIDTVAKDWDGNLPMTLVINNASHVRQMYAHDFTYDSLRSTLEPFLK